MAYNKKKLVEFINDTIIMNEGLSPTMVKDIERIIKTQIEMGDADDYIKTLSTDNQEIRKLLEGVLDGSVTIESVANITNITNIPTPTTPNGDTTITVVPDKSEGSFRDALNKNILTNSKFMMAGGEALKDAMGDIQNGVSSQLNTILGEEKENVIDPMIGVGKGVGRMFNTLRGTNEEDVDIAGESKEILDDIYEVNKEHLDSINGVGKKLDETLKIGHDSLELTKAEALRAQRERDEGPEDSFFVKLVKKILLIIAAGLISGAVVGAMMKPFEVMGKGALYAAKNIGLMSAATADGVQSASWIGAKLRSMDSLGGLFTKLDGLSEMSKRFKSWRVVLKSVTTFEDFFATMADLPYHLRTMAGSAEHVADAADEANRAARFAEKWPKLSRGLNVIRTSITGIVNSIKGFFAGDGFIAKALKGIGKVLMKFSGLRTILAGMATLPGKINLFVKAFGVGFAKLAWPLTILLGIIDGVVGFMKSNEETFLGKVKDAFMAVIKGFIEMPIKLLGWIYDKALNFVGIKSSGSGDKMVGMIMGMIDSVLSPIVSIMNFLIDVLWSPMKLIFGTVKNASKTILTVLFAAIKVIWAPIKLVIQTVMTFVRMVGQMIGGVFTIIGGILSSIIGTIGGLVKAFFSFITGDIAGGMDALGGVGDVLRAGLNTIIDGLMAIFEAPVSWLMGVWGYIKDALGDMVDGLLRALMAPFTFIKDQIDTVISTMTGYMEGTIFEPIFELFTQIGGFIEKVIKWVGDKVKSIPIVGTLFASEEEKENKRNEKDKAQIIEINDERMKLAGNITKLEADPDLGFWGKRKLKGLREDDRDLQEEARMLQLAIDERNGVQARPIHGVSKIVGEEKKKIDKSFMGGALAQAKHVMNPHATDANGEPRQRAFGYDGNVDYAGLDPYRNRGEVDSTISHISQSPPNQAFAISQEADRAKAEAIVKQIESVQQVNQAVERLRKDANETSDRPIVVNTGGQEKRLIEPPEDIESMSILFLNKSWGMG